MRIVTAVTFHYMQECGITADNEGASGERSRSALPSQSWCDHRARVVVLYTERHALAPFVPTNLAARVALRSSPHFECFTFSRAGPSMSLFKSRPDASAPSTSGAGYSVLDAQLTVRGDIETEGTLRVDGRLEGSIRRADVVVIGTGASVVGDISAREVIVGGTVEGNVTATTRVELQPSAVVTGDIDAGAIMIHEGGAVQGRLCVNATAPKERPAGTKTKRTGPIPTPTPALSGSGA